MSDQSEIEKKKPVELPQETFSDDDFDVHGFHDDRRVMIANMAATIAAGLMSRKDIDPNGDLQSYADCALDITLRILNRLESKKSPTPSKAGRTPKPKASEP